MAERSFPVRPKNGRLMTKQEAVQNDHFATAFLDIQTCRIGELQMHRAVFEHFRALYMQF
ncbi:hypothetical protein A7X67_07505 [Clostridium sp. W14A]|nr:hypothetical protein A7X67_07505 [Clostridium sp. W14A]